MINPNASSLPDLSQELASAMDWWREAGLDQDFSDDATVWLPPHHDKSSATAPENASAQASKGMNGGAKSEPASNTKPAEPIDFFAEGKPQTLEEFKQFWLTAPGLDVIGPRGRIAPRGPHQAEVMILVLDPEASDTTNLLSGPQGQILARIVKAMGLSEDQLYIASALPRHTPMADTHELAANGMRTVLHHHITLAAPKRVIAFGPALAPLLGQNVERSAKLEDTNPSAPHPAVLISEGLDSLIEMPRLKARFWRRWIEWSALH